MPGVIQQKKVDNFMSCRLNVSLTERRSMKAFIIIRELKLAATEGNSLAPQYLIRG